MRSRTGWQRSSEEAETNLWHCWMPRIWTTPLLRRDAACATSPQVEFATDGCSHRSYSQCFRATHMRRATAMQLRISCELLEDLCSHGQGISSLLTWASCTSLQTDEATCMELSRPMTARRLRPSSFLRS